MDNTLLALIVVFIVGLIVGGLILWEAAVRWFRRRDAGRARRTKALESQVADLQDGLQKDPARLGIDLGKEYAVNEMDKTIQRIREEL